jgi:fructose-1,6-bisphosphatase/sedoheptulose 1,7-bisphosphatase-like protein
MHSDLSLEFLRVVEQAAIACAHTMGQGDRHKADQAAVEAMRRVMDTVPIDGTIVIGEGERDEAPMLYIGEKVGQVHARDINGPRPVRYDEVDIAVDPLEGTNLCATGAPNAIAVLAASERLGRDVEDLVVVVLDRPRHDKLIDDIRASGARIRLIGDGDLSAGIAAAVVGSGVHAVMGTGGAPEGVLTAAAMRCLNGEILARLVVTKPEHEERCLAMGITDTKRVYRAKDLAPGNQIIFAATGVTDGTLMRGVRFFGEGIRTNSVIMQNEPHQIRFIDSIHITAKKDVKVRF